MKNSYGDIWVRKIMNRIDLKIVLTIFFIFNTTITFAKQPIECLLNVKVIASQQYTSPQAQYTRIKNDGYPMLLIGIQVMGAETMRNSQTIEAHHAYCKTLIGQQRDAYLSGPHDPNKITIKIGDQLSLRNIHSSAQEYPFWPDFYYVED